MDVNVTLEVVSWEHHKTDSRYKDHRRNVRTLYAVALVMNFANGLKREERLTGGSEDRADVASRVAGFALQYGFN